MSSNSEVKVHCSVPELVLSEVKEELPDIKHEVKIEEETVLPELIKTEIKNEEYNHFKKKEEIRVKKEECLVKKEEYDLVIKKEEHDLDHLKCFTCPSCSMHFVNEEPFLDHILHQHHVNAASSEQSNKLPNQAINLVKDFPGAEKVAFFSKASHSSLGMVKKVDHQVSYSSTPELKLASGKVNEFEVDENLSNTSLSPQDVTRTTSSDCPEHILSKTQNIHDLTYSVPPRIPSGQKSHKCRECSYNTILKCSECSFGANQEYYLKRHQLAQSGERPFQCPPSPSHGKTRSNLNRHDQVVRNDKGERPFQCSECSYSAAHESNLKRHQQTHSGERPFKCPLCPYSAKQKSHLRLHKIFHNELPKFRCSECSYRTSNEAKLKQHQHISNHINEKSFKCSQCSFTTAYKSSWIQHQQTHLGGPFQCSDCSYSGSQKAHLKMHLWLFHSSVQQHHINSASSKQKDKLSNQTIQRLDHQVSNHSFPKLVLGKRNEIEVHENLSTTSFSPQDATKTRSSEFYSEHIYSKPQTNHDLTVTVPQKVLFQCPLCLYCAKTKSNLGKHHQKVHNRKQLFRCSECSFITRDKFHLKRHQQSHLSEKLSYQCLHCPYRGRRKSDLRKHFMVIHLNEVKTYQCSECSFNTAHKSRLKRHQQSHSSERPFKCSDCPYSAKQKSTLKRHQQTHLIKRNFQIDASSMESSFGISSSKV